MENTTNTNHSVKKKGADADKVAVNVESMLDTLRKRIEEIYRREVDKSEVTSKKTIDLLNEIEIRCHAGMKALKNLHRLDDTATQQIERQQRTDFKQEIGQERLAKQREIEEEKAREMETRKKKEFKKIGRTVMVRSQKPTKKKQEVKQTVDQAELDNKKYLGDLNELVQAQAMNKTGDQSNR